jgi:rabconnectin-3b
MQSESLILPLLLNPSGQKPLIEHACATASPTKLISWGLHEGERGSVLEAGAAMGCEDGSIYLFCIDTTTANMVNQLVSSNLSPGNHPASLYLPHLASHVSRETSPSPSPPPSIKIPTHSQNPSVSNHVPHPLSQPTRSRITSFVSKASAEAPKNYVDYDNEKDKLEGMLKGGPNVREKSIVDGLRPSSAVAGLGVRSEVEGNGGSQRKRLRLSYTGSTPPTPRTPRESLSSPPSPSSLSSLSSPNIVPPPPPGQSFHVGMAPPLTLKFHVLPPYFGRENRVVSLHYLPCGILITLQESGCDSFPD